MREELLRTGRYSGSIVMVSRAGNYPRVLLSSKRSLKLSYLSACLLPRRRSTRILPALFFAATLSACASTVPIPGCPAPSEALMAPSKPLPPIMDGSQQGLADLSIADAGRYYSLAKDKDAVVQWGKDHCHWGN